jgi:hypothetical protein
MAATAEKERAPVAATAPAPWPQRGLAASDFRQVGRGGLGDGHNSFAHSMAWFRDKIYLGTTRSNLCMLKQQDTAKDIPLAVWPIECPDTMDGLYRLDRRAQIWSYDPAGDRWDMVFRSPTVDAVTGSESVPRDIGYRSMEVFQSSSDREPALYVGAWAPGRAPGGLLLRSRDGAEFEPITPYGIVDPPIQTTRSLLAFKGKLYFAPTARRGTEGVQQNTAALPLIFESRDPGRGSWRVICEPGFGDPGNLGVFTLAAFGGQLYAGTFNLGGFQVWASDCKGKTPYRWRKVIDGGAGRGALNQVVVSMTAFRDALFVGSGIQGGGIDRANGIGPAAAEVIRINGDDSWDLIVGDPREIASGPVEPLSGLRAGFGNFFSGYVWAMASHAGWLYAGTYDWSLTMRWSELRRSPPNVQRLFQLLDPEVVIEHEAGADLWRSSDGENWLPVTRQGFGNPFNVGVRNLVSTPHGLFVGTANLFGPRVAVRAGDGWRYEDNPAGGLEVWLGARSEAA